MKPGGWGVIMCVEFAKSHIIMVISLNVSVTRMKILAVVSEISHIGSYLTCLGPRSYVSVSALTTGQINHVKPRMTSAARDLCRIPLLFWYKLQWCLRPPLATTNTMGSELKFRIAVVVFGMFPVVLLTLLIFKM
jgi:hypothetical protein